jgi:hypothetical protein
VVKSTIISTMSDQVEEIFVKNSQKNIKKKASDKADQTKSLDDISTEKLPKNTEDEVIIL